MASPNLIYSITGSKISSVEGFNKITVSFTPDLTYQAFECRATKKGEDFGVGKGMLIASFSYTPLGVERTFDIYDSYLIKGDGDYRISLYAQGIDGAWNDTTWFAPQGSANMSCAGGNLFLSARG